MGARSQVLRQQGGGRCRLVRSRRAGAPLPLRSVPGGGPDAFLFAALAVLAACCLHFSALSAVLVLVAGALAEGVVFPLNLGRLGNAFTLWLGIDPPEVFFYAFLPPLLLDSALSIDYFLFIKAGGVPRACVPPCA